MVTRADCAGKRGRSALAASFAAAAASSFDFASALALLSCVPVSAALTAALCFSSSARDEIGRWKPLKRIRGSKVDGSIVVEKASRDVRAYDKNGKLLRFYPATIGSTEKPAPSGIFEVRRVAYNPDYHYNPKFAWKGVKAKEPLTIRPGPNTTVGLVWIDLTAPSYGIHGTPEPDKIGKTESHGCIRLTNWDALDLAGVLHKGTVVRFVDRDSAAGSQAAK
jgi:lipoprotein-anchoring transpeptidase ErfK/SrfK